VNGVAERFVLDAIEPTPWKNGAGATREIAVEPRTGDFDWRLSVAEVDRAAPFSAYPGVDRVIVLLGGGGLRLRGEVAHELAEPFAPFAFPGEARIEGEPIGGATQDFNMMTRRGRWHGAVEALRTAAALPAADAGVLMCVQGRWAHPTLASGEGLVWRDGRPAMTVEPGSRDAVLLAVTLTQ
jgi:hypothetical protein